MRNIDKTKRKFEKTLLTLLEEKSIDAIEEKKPDTFLYLTLVS